MDFNEIIFRYYGFDWLAFVFSVLSIAKFKDKNIKGFVFGGLACISWLAYNAVALSLAGVIANFFFIYMHYKGYEEWKKDE